MLLPIPFFICSGTPKAAASTDMAAWQAAMDIMDALQQKLNIRFPEARRKLTRRVDKTAFTGNKQPLFPDFALSLRSVNISIVEYV